MLAYSKNKTLQFRDETSPLAGHLSAVMSSQGDISSTPTPMEPEEPSLAPPEVLAGDLDEIIEVERHISFPWSQLFSFECFNAVQSACFNLAACTNENFVVSAPTGCGKTVLFELAILRLLSSRFHEDAKVVLLAPIKALCQEKVKDWSQRLSPFGIKVTELSGDSHQADMKDINQARIICTTPEKWDSITRRFTEHIYLLGKVELLLVDEAHNLNDSRGATLEAVICRMKTVAKSAPVRQHNLPAARLRIIALSATLPNLACIGEFVQARPESVLAFDASFRPVPLAVHVVGFPLQSSDFWFEKSLEKRVSEVVDKYSNGRPTLCFCGSRQSTEVTAALLGHSRPSAPAARRDPALVEAGHRVSPKLRDALLRGVGFHHAHLDAAERAIVEGLFRDRKLSVLCCTSTLAMGVNLPAYLVVVKSTAQWQGKATGYGQMPSSTILQMMGRAGRPGLDEAGVAVIMTDDANRAHYENIAVSLEVVESSLHEELTEILNSEVCNRVVETVEDASQWVKGTFLFTRLKSNPQRYGLALPASAKVTDAIATDHLDGKLRAALHELNGAGLVAFGEDGSVVPNKPAHIMSRNMLRLSTMKTIMGMSPHCNIEELLLALSTCVEVVHDVRHGQKKVLREVFGNMRFPFLKSKKIETVDKTFILLQCLIGRVSVDDQTMVKEINASAEKAGRVLNAFVEHAVDTGAGRTALSSVILRRNISQRCWESGMTQLNCFEELLQAPSILKLAEAGFSTIESVAGASPVVLENHVGRRAPLGAKLVSAARRILDQALTFELVERERTIEVSITGRHFPWGQATSSAMVPVQDRVTYTLIAFTREPKKSLPGTTNAHGIHLYRKISGPCVVEVPVSSMTAIHESSLIVSLIATVVGLDEHRSLTLKGALDITKASTEPSEQKAAAPARSKLTEADARELLEDDASPAAGAKKPKQPKKAAPAKKSSNKKVEESSSSFSEFSFTSTNESPAGYSQKDVPDRGDTSSVPTSTGFSRKAQVGSRDIRDCFTGTGPMNVLRKKAAEMDVMSIPSLLLNSRPVLHPIETASMEAPFPDNFGGRSLDFSANDISMARMDPELMTEPFDSGPAVRQPMRASSFFKPERERPRRDDFGAEPDRGVSSRPSHDSSSSSSSSPMTSPLLQPRQDSRFQFSREGHTRLPRDDEARSLPPRGDPPLPRGEPSPRTREDAWPHSERRPPGPPGPSGPPLDSQYPRVSNEPRAQPPRELPRARPPGEEVHFQPPRARNDPAPMLREEPPFVQVVVARSREEPGEPRRDGPRLERPRAREGQAAQLPQDECRSQQPRGRPEPAQLARDEPCLLKSTEVRELASSQQQPPLLSGAGSASGPRLAPAYGGHKDLLPPPPPPSREEQHHQFTPSQDTQDAKRPKVSAAPRTDQKKSAPRTPSVPTKIDFDVFF